MPRTFSIIALTRRKDVLAYEEIKAIDDGRFLSVMIPKGVGSVTFSTGEAEVQPMRSVSDYEKQKPETTGIDGEPLYMMPRQRGPEIAVMSEKQVPTGVILHIRCAVCEEIFTAPKSLPRAFCTSGCRKLHFQPPV